MLVNTSSVYFLGLRSQEDYDQSSQEFACMNEVRQMVAEDYSLRKKTSGRAG